MNQRACTCVHDLEDVLEYDPNCVMHGGFDASRPWPKTKRPTIVCLCGSTRFYHAFVHANYERTMNGEIVLSVGHYPNSYIHGQNFACTVEQKKQLDILHKRKIDLCDYILVLNVGGYIGESTRSEIEYAHAKRKPVCFLEPIGNALL